MVEKRDDVVAVVEPVADPVWNWMLEPSGFVETVDGGVRWRAIGSYQVSDTGVVRRVAPGPGTSPGKVLTLGAPRGRLVVTLTENGVPRPMRMTELMAHVWMGGVPDGFKVGFVDGNPLNVAVTNLQFVPLRKPKPEPRPRRKSTTPPWNKRLTDAAAAEIRKLYEIEQAERMTLKKIAAKYGVSESLVSKIVRGHRFAGG